MANSNPNQVLSEDDRHVAIKDAAQDRGTATFKDYDSERSKLSDFLAGGLRVISGDPDPAQVAQEKQQIYDNIREKNG